ncbi:hypothetical protein WA026_009705 [Henosepilachna vigintioctopunctata]|uniref:Uncharacterized protein n=1 Tax=Henosepilachna vigintioctopunctata TaxID=420089 RepID=A0AAW1TWH0_9CUCU
MKYLIILGFVATSVLSDTVNDTPQISLTQDALGNYKLDISYNGFSRSEVGTANGDVRGSYKYNDANGKLQSVEYTSGPQGFQANGTNIPVESKVVQVPVNYTEEVQKARVEHLALFNL